MCKHIALICVNILLIYVNTLRRFLCAWYSKQQAALRPPVVLLLLFVCPDGIVYEPTFVGLSAQLLDVVQVASEINHLLPALSARRVRLTYAVIFVDFLCHSTIYWFNVIECRGAAISAIFIYFCDVSRCECPNILAMVVVVSPFFASSVAKVCLIACGLSCLLLL